MIIIHELGHFLFARLFKVYVQEFSLFIGPKIWSKKFGDTVYSLRTIPIAAYVKMEGEEEYSESELAYNKKPVWQRALIVFGGPLANLLSAYLVLLVLFSIKPIDTTQIERIAEDSPAIQAGFQVGDEIIRYDGNKTYSPRDVFLLAYAERSEEAVVTVKRNEELITLNFKPIVDRKTYVMGAQFDVSGKKMLVLAATPNSPAAEAGLKPGDHILSIDGTEVFDILDIRDAVQKSNGNPMEIILERGQEQQTLQIKPVERNEQIYLGLGFTTKKLDNIFQAVGPSFTFVYSNVKNVVYTLQLLTSQKAQLTDLSGPVGIVANMNAVVSQSEGAKEVFVNLLDIFAFISIAIGATNLIPFPPLDGSKLVFLGIEGIIRRPVPVKVEALISTVGMTLLLALVFVVTFSDIRRVLTGFFN